MKLISGQDHGAYIEWTINQC